MDEYCLRGHRLRLADLSARFTFLTAPNFCGRPRPGRASFSISARSPPIRSTSGYSRPPSINMQDLHPLRAKSHPNSHSIAILRIPPCLAADNNGHDHDLFPGITGPGPGTSLFSTVTSLIDGLNTLPSGADSLYQSFYQTAVSTTPTKVITRTASRARSSTRRKVSSTQGKLVSRTTTATSVQKSTAQNVQQTPNQTQTFSAIQAPNQMMMGGIGAVGGIGGVGAGLGGTGGLGSVGSGLGGLGGLGGHH